MRAVTSFTLNLAALVLIAIGSATIAAAGAGSDTCAGVDATLDGTCTPLTNTTSGSNSNAAFGAQALESNTTGFNNTATGAGALEENTAGQNNSGSGEGARFANSTGNDNTAAGWFALDHNT